MPSNKTKSKEDTWTTDELENSMMEIRRQKRKTDERRKEHSRDVNGETYQKSTGDKKGMRSHTKEDAKTERHSHERHKDITEEKHRKERKKETLEKDATVENYKEKSIRDHKRTDNKVYDDEKRHRKNKHEDRYADDNRGDRDDGHRERVHKTREAKTEEKRQRRDESSEDKMYGGIDVDKILKKHEREGRHILGKPNNEEDYKKDKKKNDKKKKDGGDEKNYRVDNYNTFGYDQNEGRIESKERRRDKHYKDDKRYKEDRHTTERRDREAKDRSRERRKHRRDEDETVDLHEEERTKNELYRQNDGHIAQEKVAKSAAPQPSQPTEGEGDGYDDYEDDFESYDDDFEDDDDEDDDDNDEGSSTDDIAQFTKDKTMDELLHVLDAENDRLIQSSNQQTHTSEISYENSTRHRSGINFSTASAKIRLNKMASKSMRRARDLLPLLELDIADFSMIDLPPVNEYDMYIRCFGRSNTQQAYVQTNEDNLDRDIQTDEIEQRSSWNQHPPDSSVASATEKSDISADSEGFDTHPLTKFTSNDTQQFTKFIVNAGHVVLTLLEEQLAYEYTDQSHTNQTSVNISEGFMTLGHTPYLKGYSLDKATFSIDRHHLLLTNHIAPQTPGDPCNPIILAVWNINQPSKPQKFLICQSTPSSCCFSPAPSNFVFAAFSDGSLAMWDLRESISLHQTITTEDDTDITLRRHTYNTAGVLSPYNHHGSIIHIAIANADSNVHDLRSNTSFQIVTADEFGIVHFWVIGELSKTDMSDTDPCLSPGGRFKLIKMATISFNALHKTDDLHTTHVTCFIPDRHNQNIFYAGTESGSVIRCSRFGKQPIPRCYTVLPESPVAVTCLDVSPFKLSCFLVGYKDGTVRLYNTKADTPVTDWSPPDGSTSVTNVRFSVTRPAVFFILYNNNVLRVFDLVDTDSQPLFTEHLADPRVTGIDFPANDNQTSRQNASQQMLIQRHGNSVEIHTLKAPVCEAQVLELEYMDNYIQRY